MAAVRALGTLGAIAALLAGAAAGCSHDDATSEDTSEIGVEPAVMVAARVFSPEGRTTNVGVYPDIPTGTLSLGTMVEMGNADARAFGGSVYVSSRESARVTRYDVTDDPRLVEGETISFASYGNDFLELIFISSSRAYTLIGDTVVVWNPTTMEITSDFPAMLPEREGLDINAGAIGVVGDRVMWTLASANFEDQRSYTRQSVAIAPAQQDGPVTIVEDDRPCLPGKGYVLPNGDLYLISSWLSATYSIYGPTADTPMCIIRIRAGTQVFDPDYYVNLHDVTGSPSVGGSVLIDDENLLLRVWDPADTLPVAPDDYWDAEGFRSQRLRMFNLVTATVTDFPALPKGRTAFAWEHRVDGATYFDLEYGDGLTALYRLGRDSIEEIYRIAGARHWFLARVR